MAERKRMNEDETLRITLESNIDESYDIIFGARLFSRIAEDLAGLKLGSSYAIITDSNVAGLYGNEMLQAMARKKIRGDIFAFPAGEQNKNVDTCVSLLNDLQRSEHGRDSWIIALGGGVVGDVAGFVAAIHLRGVPYIQVPTTLLAQADASIGGKTGVNTAQGKNLVGAFNQPKRVYMDVSTLETLSKEEYRNGLAETIKHAVVYSSDFFEYLENNIQPILQLNENSLIALARMNCSIKGRVVQRDPRETGIRRILNYGHTIGHALELASGYTLSHGACVSRGMMVEGKIAHDLGYFSREDMKRQEDLLVKSGLPIYIPRDIDSSALIKATRSDKKNFAGKVRYSLPQAIGRMHQFDGTYATAVDDAVVRHALHDRQTLL